MLPFLTFGIALVLLTHTPRAGDAPKAEVKVATPELCPADTCDVPCPEPAPKACPPCAECP
jgi:hypothetical protein